MKRCDCALDAAMEVIDGRWKTTILCMLYKNGPMRFSQLQSLIGVVSARMLSKQLKELEADNMILRTEVVKGAVKVEYSLTPKGLSIIPPLKELAVWSLNHQMINVIVPNDNPPSELTIDCLDMPSISSDGETESR